MEKTAQREAGADALFYSIAGAPLCGGFGYRLSAIDRLPRLTISHLEQFTH